MDRSPLDNYACQSQCYYNIIKEKFVIALPTSFMDHLQGEGIVMPCFIFAIDMLILNFNSPVEMEVRVNQKCAIYHKYAASAIHVL